MLSWDLAHYWEPSPWLPWCIELIKTSDLSFLAWARTQGSFLCSSAWLLMGPNHCTFIIAYTSKPTTPWVPCFLVRHRGKVYFALSVLWEQPWGLISGSPEGIRLEPPEDKHFMITVAGTRWLQTAKGSLALFWYLHPYFGDKPVLADFSPTAWKLYLELPSSSSFASSCP